MKIIISILLFTNLNTFSNDTIKISTENMPPEAKPSYTQKWWSNSFFGSVHKKIAEKAFELIDPAEYPDIVYYKKQIIEGSSDEDGHPDITHNGGNVYQIWFSSKVIYGPTNEDSNPNIERLIGVYYHYNNFNFKEAYENIGIICHLTQDQAVTVHAANIKHMFFDQFERFYEDDNNITLTINDFLPEDLKPWEYYQFVQDDTRMHLNQWIDPETKIPYWEQAKDAPPLGQDSTYGPHGNYGGGKDHFAKTVCEENYDGSNQCKSVPKSPEIRERQISVAVYATAKILKSASKTIPPLINNIEQIQNNSVKIKVIENRCKKIDYEIIKENKTILSNSIYMDTKTIPFETTIIEKNLKPGRYEVIIKDCDENKSSSKFTIE